MVVQWNGANFSWNSLTNVLLKSSNETRDNTEKTLQKFVQVQFVDGAEAPSESNGKHL